MPNIPMGRSPSLPAHHGAFLSLRKPEYRLEELLGMGGHAVVYRATHLDLMKPVAVKIPYYRRLARGHIPEASLLSAVRHHAIPSIEARLVHEGSEVVIMEYIEGESLFDVLQSHQAIPVSAALEIVALVASALQVLHEPEPEHDDKHRPIVHCDVKPGNVLITRHGGVKLIDFDIAQFESRDRRRRIFGSASYMAPERILRVTTTAADIFSLGALLLEMTTGQPLPAVETLDQLPQALQQQASSLGEDLRELILSMLHVVYGARPTAREVADTCRSLMQTEELPGLSTWARSSISRVSGPTLDSNLIGRIIPDRPPGLWERLRWGWRGLTRRRIPKKR